ncbi:hypothetical protein HanPI659440_Chr15g0612051 [Helianthus annuus]|nr:hypothetical protein HanPI659440_Chr15g0612051 [Helianthus annuus]
MSLEKQALLTMLITNRERCTADATTACVVQPRVDAVASCSRSRCGAFGRCCAGRAAEAAAAAAVASCSRNRCGIDGRCRERRAAGATTVCVV